MQAIHGNGCGSVEADAGGVGVGIGVSLTSQTVPSTVLIIQAKHTDGGSGRLHILFGIKNLGTPIRLQ